MNNSLIIGILAHVDAGKTSLTERLLFDNGVIKTLGSVDQGNTQTDTMALERQRGITIKSAVVSFNTKKLKINIIDTPGHPDFIAEVERALKVLDAVILVISAVEGIQPQTRVLMRTLKKLHIPTLIFINKIDRMGARSTELVTEIETKLFPQLITLNSVINIGSKSAKTSAIEIGITQSELIAQINQMEFCPVIFGSALTGVGIPELMDALETYFSPVKNNDDQLSALVFKIERGLRDEKIAYVRIYSGELKSRTEVGIQRVNTTIKSKVTRIELFENGKSIEVTSAQAGDIIKIFGMHEVQIDDWIGQPIKGTDTYFALPSLEVVITPEKPTDRTKLHNALTRMSEQDPFIQVHQNEQGVLSVRLYGEVQREIIKTLLHDGYGLDVTFENPQIIYIEKVVGTGKSFADKDNFFEATLGFKIGPAPLNSGIIFKPGPGIGGLPVAFLNAVEESVYKTLRQGIYGWEVKDCIIEVTDVGYWDATSNGGDFRGLTPLLLGEALKQAGTEVYEPLNRFELDAPELLLGKILQRLTKARAKIDSIVTTHETSHIEGEIPLQNVFDFERSIPDLTGGEGTFISEFSGYQRFHGTQPVRKRIDFNYLNRKEYLGHVLKQG